MNELFLESLYKSNFKMLDLSKWSKDSNLHDEDEEAEEDEEESTETRQQRKARELTKYMQYVTASD